MSEWTPEAQAYLEGYLQQVAALARHSGDDAPDIEENLREHIRCEAEMDACTFITLERVRQIIAVVGTPEQVVEMDFPKAPPETAPERLTEAQAADRAGLSLEAPQVTHVYQPMPPQKTRTSPMTCLLIAIGLFFLTPVLIAVLGIVSAIVLPSLSRSREAASRASCQGNLKQVAVVLKIYANENEERYPALSEEAGRLMFSSNGMEDILTEPMILTCPSSRSEPDIDSWEEGFDDHDFIYLSHILRTEEEGLAFIEAYRKAASEGSSFDRDFQGADGATIYRMTEQNIRELGLAAAEIPVVFDRYPVHMPGGGSVLYLDGHTEFVKLNDKFPMTETFLDALETICK